MTGLGTLLRHVHELMDGAVAEIYAEHGLPGYRPRFSPYVRTLVAEGPMAIRDLASAVGVTHSAASQTVVQMRRCELVTLEKGADARQRIVHLTERARAALPLIEAEWAATERAVGELDGELPVPLTEVLRATVAALERRPFRARVEAARALGPAARAEAGGALDSRA
ncbi:winged helix DNA-binding protein [Actinomadura sp. ATCC 31491]|uniref:Winged helix DNA-binding protein n=1 Tax=Actinomadura luzonensis TaxID=2805427 RepID=A0ABT0FQ34_9ACTN|nr:winged helix DNA-binding protein [Actinomadura luzonensis]MCK2214463.1 winged helix DNA-binding protein [Actinomadura luzonensis]